MLKRFLFQADIRIMMIQTSVRMRHLFLLMILWGIVFFPGTSLFAQDVLRGEVRIELEQIRGFLVEAKPPLNIAEARMAALRDAAHFFGAIIYGWSFHYDIGERARNIEEKLELSPLGTISPEDHRLEITDLQINGPYIYLWSDYRPNEAQHYRLAKWKTGSVRTAQGYGQSSMEDKYGALEDAARAAIRGMLQGSERNRPKEASGFISLTVFPRFWMDKGRWAAMGRFRIEIQEIRPFAVH